MMPEECVSLTRKFDTDNRFRNTSNVRGNAEGDVNRKRLWDEYECFHSLFNCISLPHM